MAKGTSAASSFHGRLETNQYRIATHRFAALDYPQMEGGDDEARVPSDAAGFENELGQTVKAMRPMVPAKDFATSRRFYEELGFRPEVLADGLVEMHLGKYSFILQDYYVEQWANNFVFHLRVSDVILWWNGIVSLKLVERYGKEPHPESWGMAADIIDPSGVLWRVAGSIPQKGPGSRFRANGGARSRTDFLR